MVDKPIKLSPPSADSLAMKQIISLLLISILTLATNLSHASDAVYDKYRHLVNHLDERDNVLSFINENNYLSDRLQKKWLFFLAKKKRWQGYIDAYKPSKNTSLQCYHLTALYYTGQESLALSKVKPLWLTGHKQPKACGPLFTIWRESDIFSKQLLWKRFSLAIEARQYTLAKALMQSMDAEDRKVAKKWIMVSHVPQKLKTLRFPKHEQNAAVHTHGLRKLVKINTDSAIKHWHEVKDKYAFSHEQRQWFIRTVALYAAMRNREDAEQWFVQLDVDVTPTMHLEWRVRAALKNRHWKNVATAIDAMPDTLRQKHCWQYWYARSVAALGNKDKAMVIYKKLSQQRHYYGFLASHRAKLPMNMQEDNYKDNDLLLEDYQTHINHINTLYKKKQTHKANLLSYELANSLSKEAQYQLAREYSDWQWHAKALMLANLSQYKHDLRIRFPLAHMALIEKFSKQYQIEKPLIYAIIRQESTFRKKAKSSANAMGLMQVIPSTARKIARKHRIPLGNLNKMYQPKTNVNVGTAYLHHLSKRFNSHPVLMAAAYNAGPRQVYYWLKKHPFHDSDIWIETLPWGETRNYLKNVLSFYAVYQYRLNKTPSIKTFMRPIEI